VSDMCRSIEEENYAYHIPVKMSAYASIRLKYTRKVTKGSWRSQSEIG